MDLTWLASILGLKPSHKEIEMPRFSGNYLCKCVEAYYISRKAKESSFEMTDKHAYDLFMSVRFPCHTDDANGKRICNAEHKAYFEEFEGRNLWCCSMHQKEHMPFSI